MLIFKRYISTHYIWIQYYYFPVDCPSILLVFMESLICFHSSYLDATIIIFLVTVCIRQASYGLIFSIFLIFLAVFAKDKTLHCFSEKTVIQN
jgi:hypothetical protein